MAHKVRTKVERKRKVRFWPPSLVYLSDWPPRRDCYFANCYRSIFEHENLCTVEIAKREVHWLHGVAIAQISRPAIMRSFDAGEVEAALLTIVAPALKHYGIMRGPLRVEWRDISHQIPEMAVIFGEQIETVEDGIWLTPEWSPEAEAARASHFGVCRQKADRMRRRIAKERREAAFQAERQANQQVDASQMNPLFE